MTPEVVERMQQQARLTGDREQILDDIVQRSDLDVRAVLALCDRITDAARDDLLGRYDD